MTKLKPPLTEAEALGRIIGSVTLERAATIVDRSAATVYRWGNPDTEDSTPIACAIALDRAHRQNGGIGAPFLEYLAAQVALGDADSITENLEVHRLVVEFHRAAGEASAELAELALPDATDEDWREAERDASTLYQKLTALIPLLKRGPRPKQPP